MHRKYFLSYAGLIIAGSAFSKKANGILNTSHQVFRKPPYLKKGDLIGITAPAGYIKYNEVLPAVQLMESWGFNVKLGNTIGKKDFTFGGTDPERLDDFQKMLNDKKIKAIMCARGGYGSIRIVDQLDWKIFNKFPKWIIGFSDITVLLNHIHNNFKIATVHSKMCNSFPDDWANAEPIQVQSINSIKDALSGVHMSYQAEPSSLNRLGNASGILVGGNLKTIESLSASTSDINTNGKLLFVEDTGEYLYSIDRMFWSLKRTNKLRGLHGLIIGGFNIKPDDIGDEFGKTLQDIVLEKVKNYHFPVCFNFPVGHQKANFALKCGIRHHLKVSDDKVELVETL